MKKKILSLMLAVVMMLSMGVTVAAETTTPTPTTSQTVTASISKMYTLTNVGTSSPADTFKFTVTNYAISNASSSITVSNMPTPSISDIAISKGDATTAGMSHTLSIVLPVYTSVGIYTYEVKEVDNKLAGVSYDNTTYYLVVTVTQDNGVLSVSSYYLHSGSVEGVKTDNIDNTYSAGELDITKSVTGNLGDTTEYFAVTVTLTGVEGYSYETSYNVNSSELSYSVTTTTTDGQTGQETTTTTTNPSTIVIGTPTTFYIKHGETIKIKNLPYGVTYTVVESNTYQTNEGYDAASYAYIDGTVGADTKTIDSALETATITNNRGKTVDTGVILDSAPYILILIVVATGAVVMITRKRRSEDF